MSDAQTGGFEARLNDVSLATSASFDTRVRDAMRNTLAADQISTEADVSEKGDKSMTFKSADSPLFQRALGILNMRRGLAKGAGLAAAAAVLAGMFWWMTAGPNPPMSAYGELAKAIRNSQAAEWVHFTMDRDGAQKEVWLSFSPARSGIKTKEGLSYSHADARKTYKYSYAFNTITVSASSPDLDDLDEFEGAPNFFAAFTSALEELRKEGVAIEKTYRVVDGKSYDVYSYEKAARMISFTVDPSKQRIVRLEKQVPEQTPSLPSLTAIFDYPSSGPADIYALGAPADARVIEWGYEQAQALKDKVESARAAFASEYFAIVFTEVNRQPEEAYASHGRFVVHVVHKKADRLRVDTHVQSAVDFRSQVQSVDMASLESWARARVPWSVEFYDGRDHKQGTPDTTHLKINEDGTLTKTSFEWRGPWWTLGTVEWATWGYPLPVSHDTVGTRLFPLPVKQGASGMLEGVETTDSAQNEDKTPATTRSGSYFSPQRDYAAEESVLLWFPSRSQPVSIELPAGFSPAPCGGCESVHIRRVTQYAQTPPGRWYAKLTEHDAIGAKASLTEKTEVFLDVSRSIPDDVFDLAAFEAQHQPAAK